MRDEKLNAVIKDLNTYHEEKERKYFEKNLFKQKLGKYILFFTISLVIVAIILFLIIYPEANTYEESINNVINFIKTTTLV